MYSHKQKTAMIEDLYINSSAKLYRYLYRFIKNKEEREEIVSEAFANLFEKLNKWKKKCTLETFLFITAKNIMKNRWAHQTAAKRNIIGECHAEFVLAHKTKISLGPLDILLEKELKEEISKAIDKKVSAGRKYRGAIKENQVEFLKEMFTEGIAHGDSAAAAKEYNTHNMKATKSRFKKAILEQLEAKGLV